MRLCSIFCFIKNSTCAPRGMRVCRPGTASAEGMMDEEVIRQILGSWDSPGPEQAEEMRREKWRLRSFQKWRGTVCPQLLARAGFFHVGPGDRVRCFCCGGVLRSWEPGDQPAAEHRKFFPSCPFVLGREVGNVAMAGGTDSVDGQLLGQLQRLSGEEEADDDWQAVYPQLADNLQRLGTYRTWPPYTGVTPEHLAPAGFFYTGHRDNVRCFHCDGELRNWERGDDPWREHAKWFPRCEFLVQAMGPAYIRSVQDSLLSSPETTPESQRVSDRSPISPSDSPGGWQDFLQSSVAQITLQMGFEERLVASLVQNRFLLVGTHYSSVSELVNDLVQAEEESARQCPEPEEVPEAPAQSSATHPQPPKESESEVPEAPAQSSATHPQPPKESVPLSTEEQLRRLKEERMCKICMDKDASMVFVPCGHLVVCLDCAPNLRHCPICRAAIRGSVRAFMS